MPVNLKPNLKPATGSDLAWKPHWQAQAASGTQALRLAQWHSGTCTGTEATQPPSQTASLALAVSPSHWHCLAVSLAVTRRLGVAGGAGA